jgi:hypothetical protein
VALSVYVSRRRDALPLLFEGEKVVAARFLTTDQDTDDPTWTPHPVFCCAAVGIDIDRSNHHDHTFGPFPKPYRPPSTPEENA